MTNAKVEAETLLNAVLPFAEQMLREHGEFFPFGAAMTPTGELVSVGASDGREQPPSSELIDLLVSGHRDGAEKGNYIATAVVYDVRVVPPGTTIQTDAIAAELEHRDDYAVTVFFPYALEGGQLQLGSPFATGEKRGIFSP